jgi:hypothetical protein
MYALLLLAAALASNAPEAPRAPDEASSAPPAESTTTIRWKVRGISHSLDVQRNDGGDLALVGRDSEYLRSVVGPLMSTLHRRTWQGESGTYRTLRIVTETQGPYVFDLVSWLDKSGQSGIVLRQLLESSTCDFDGKCGAPLARWPTRPQCPSAESLAAYDGGFVEMSRLLVDTQCFTEEQIRVQPEAFWVDDWNGEHVTLAVQREHCKESTTACDGRVSFVSFRPPRMWNDWLENAASAKGYLPRMLATAHNAGPVQGPPAAKPDPIPDQPEPTKEPKPTPAPGADANLPAPPPTLP